MTAAAAPPERVLAVGQGYIGLPLAMAAVAAGFDVTGYDLDKLKVSSLEAGESHIEDVSASTVRDALKSGRYRATSSIDSVECFDIAIISVPTPLRDAVPDLSYIESASATVATKLAKGNTVILESTTYPGTTEELVAPILEAGAGLEAGVDFFLGYSPVRIDPGNARWSIVNTPKVVSGVNEASLERVQGFFDRVVETTVAAVGTREAEFAKLLENTFRHVNIALVNELAVFATGLGIDIWDSIDLASTKPFGFMRFTPGPGVGGHCLPIDPSYLSWKVRRSLGTSFRFVELANEINDHMPHHVVKRVISILNEHRKPVNGSTIALLGLAYKKNGGDARESPSVTIAGQLQTLGATVVAVDPHVCRTAVPQAVHQTPSQAEATEGADIVVVLVDHAEFDFDALAGLSTPVLDCRHVVPAGGNVRRL